jgi:endogenous inhibitor of DNA gyrase (YacG/DUF329 family)
MGGDMEKRELHSCVNCGKDYEKKRPWQKYCSDRCRWVKYSEKIKRGRSE